MTRCIFLYSQIAFGHDSKTVSVRCFAFSFWVARLKLLILDYRYLFQYYLHCYLYFWRRVQDSNLYNLLVERISNPMQYQIMLNSPYYHYIWLYMPIRKQQWVTGGEPGSRTLQSFTSPEFSRLVPNRSGTLHMWFSLHRHTTNPIITFSRKRTS